MDNVTEYDRLKSQKDGMLYKPMMIVAHCSGCGCLLGAGYSDRECDKMLEKTKPLHEIACPGLSRKVKGEKE